MEPPVRTDSESIRDEKVKVLRPSLDPRMSYWPVLRLSDEPGVAKDSNTETFAALKLSGFLALARRADPIRAGNLCPSPAIAPVAAAADNVSRLRPNRTIAGFASVRYRNRFRSQRHLAENESGVPVRELLAGRHPAAEEMDAYERIAGRRDTATLRFRAQDYVEEAWRIVDPVLVARRSMNTKQRPGDRRVESRVTPPGGWQNPVLSS
jgi:glucose-6-phosphate 1-dehydrogenase